MQFSTAVWKHSVLNDWLCVSLWQWEQVRGCEKAQEETIYTLLASQLQYALTAWRVCVSFFFFFFFFSFQWQSTTATPPPKAKCRPLNHLLWMPSSRMKVCVHVCIFSFLVMEVTAIFLLCVHHPAVKISAKNNLWASMNFASLTTKHDLGRLKKTKESHQHAPALSNMLILNSWANIYFLIASGMHMHYCESLMHSYAIWSSKEKY